MKFDRYTRYRGYVGYGYLGITAVILIGTMFLVGVGLQDILIRLGVKVNTAIDVSAWACMPLGWCAAYGLHSFIDKTQRAKYEAWIKQE